MTYLSPDIYLFICTRTITLLVKEYRKCSISGLIEHFTDPVADVFALIVDHYSHIANCWLKL